jgi:hypothetical protein
MPNKAGDSIGKVNHRETGARKFPPFPGETDRDREGLEAAENEGSGLSEPMSDVPEKVRKSEGQNPTRPTGADPDQQKSAEEIGGRPPSRRPA